MVTKTKIRKKTTTAVAVVEKVILPATSCDDLAIYDELAEGAEFLDRLVLLQGTSDLVKKKKAPIGNWAIPGQNDECIDLGEVVDIFLFARRPKALDTSDREAIVENFEHTSEIFKNIRARAKTEKNSGCMYGVTFLVFERSQGRFLEFYCSSTTTRQEAKKLYPRLPRTKVDVERALVLAKEQGIPANKVEGERKPKPVTMTTFLKEAPKFSWYIPQISECSQPFANFPEISVIAAQMNAFMSRSSTTIVEDVDAPDVPVR